eukprot:545510-Rhodomonas_salina.2
MTLPVHKITSWVLHVLTVPASHGPNVIAPRDLGARVPRDRSEVTWDAGWSEVTWVGCSEVTWTMITPPLR